MRTLHRRFLLTGVLLSLNCVNAQAGVGEDTARQLESYYNATFEYCKAPD